MLLDENFITDIKSIIATARENAIRAIDHQRTLMYWHIGKRIFEEEQEGRDRADYGAYLIRSLSEKIQPEFGSGFGIRQLERYRQFYRTFPLSVVLQQPLGWTQYKLLLSIENENARSFYMGETVRNCWSSRQLEGQVYSSLYERFLVSQDRESVLEAARKERFTSKNKDIIKDPMVLEFLGLKREASYYEKDLESAIITRIQQYLLELGNGFSFVARQKRIHIEGDEFFVDLVCYNRLLQCFVIIEIKTQKLTHQDLGQLQMYVNYYDRIEKLSRESATIGILLCASKNDAVVKFTLPEGQQQIVASQYALYLPSEQQLLEEMNKEIVSFEEKGSNSLDAKKI